MAVKKTAEPFSLVDALRAAYATNNRINTFLIRSLPDEAWNAKPAGGKGRTAASILAHMHNVRILWLKSAGNGARLPGKLEGDTLTKDDAIRALEESWQAIDDLLGSALSTDGRVKGFRPDAASFLAYLIAHDAHHRGQISMLARQAGHPLSQSAMYGLWEWGTR